MHKGYQVLLALLFLAFCTVLFNFWPRNSEQWASWVQAVGSVAAIVAAIWIASEQHRTAEKREADQRAAANRNYLCATRAELSALWNMYILRVGDQLQAHDTSTLLDIIWPIDHDPFVVYNSNAKMLAEIDDDELRNLMIRTYAQGRGLISTWRMHNSLLADVLRLARYANEFPSDSTKATAEGAYQMALDYGPVLQEVHMELATLVPHCIERLDASINRIKVQA